MAITVYAQTTVEGLHCWPAAPDEVSFLRDPHRHLFYVKVGVDVTGDDREVEFILLGRQVVTVLARRFTQTHGVFDFKTSSCEQLAKILLEALNLDFCEVSEDGENGVIVRGG